MASEPSSVYRRDGEQFVPSILAQGPWDSGAQHGGPVAALLARNMEMVPAAAAMRFVRVTVDLMRSVPLAPLTSQVEVVRAGRRIEVLSSRLFHEGRLVAQATGLRMRRLDAGAVEFDAVRQSYPQDLRPEPVDPSSTFQTPNVGGFEPGFRQAVDVHWVRRPGPGPLVAELWTRVHRPLLDDEPVSPLVRAMWAADIATGVGSGLDRRRYTSINPDLDVYLWREPSTEWLAVRATAKMEGDGIGYSDADLFDEDGRFGRSVASMLLEPR